MKVDENLITLCFGTMVVVSFFGIVGILAYHTVPVENKDILLGATGVVFAAFNSLAQKILGIIKTPALGTDTTPPPGGATPTPGAGSAAGPLVQPQEKKS
jgi:hypothetical protein